MERQEERRDVFRVRLKKLMHEKGMNQQELADKLGVRRQTVQLYEAGGAAPKIDGILAIAEAFDVSADYLIGLSNEPSPKADVQAISKKYGLSGAALETLAALREDYEWAAGEKSDATRFLARAEPLLQKFEPARRDEVMEKYKEDIMPFLLRRMKIINLLFSSCGIAEMFFDAIADIIDVQSKEEENFKISRWGGGERFFVQDGRTIKFSLAASLCDILAQAVALNTPPETPKRGGKNATSKKEEG
jgi:transcriptional regulator with XRE-family HTH domain